MGDNISTDEILPAGAQVLPYRSNIPKISEFVFNHVDEYVCQPCKGIAENGQQHAIIGGENYGQGSSREHAALAPRYLGLQLVIAKSFARIHWQNLINFGILPMTFVNPEDYKKFEKEKIIIVNDVIKNIKNSQYLMAKIEGESAEIKLQHHLSKRQIEILEEGGLINWVKNHEPTKASKGV